ncbi:MAG: HipA family kinase [Akkermansiaceae bacterium]
MPIAVSAFNLHEQFPSGRTAPCLVEARDESGEIHAVVVKIFSESEGGHKASAAELVCSLLGQALGLRPPEPYLVTLPEGFESLVNCESTQTKIRQSEGLYFGCKYLSGASIVSPERSISESKLSEAAQIFTFDGLVQNPDRRVGKPNLLESDEGYHLIDHDQALGDFRFPTFVSTVAPWDESAERSPAYEFLKNHLFHQGLHGKEEFFDDAEKQLAELNQDDILAILESVPPIWWGDSSMFQQLKDYLEQAPLKTTEIISLVKSYLSTP